LALIATGAAAVHGPAAGASGDPLAVPPHERGLHQGVMLDRASQAASHGGSCFRLWRWLNAGNERDEKGA
jgi:hypothetical protein